MTDRDDLRDRLAEVLRAHDELPYDLQADAVLAELAPVLTEAQMLPERRAIPDDLWDELLAWEPKSPEARS